jgi:hypothetical protein
VRAPPRFTLHINRKCATHTSGPFTCTPPFWMAFLLNKHSQFSLGHALTGDLTDAMCQSLVSSVQEEVRLMAAAACVWNQSATTSETTVAAWRGKYNHVRDGTWVAIINHTRFPQCRTGIPFLEVGGRLTDFAFQQTQLVSVLECFLRRLRPDFTADELKDSALARVLASCCI